MQFPAKNAPPSIRYTGRHGHVKVYLGRRRKQSNSAEPLQPQSREEEFVAHLGNVFFLADLR